MPGLPPDLLAEHLAEAGFEVADLGGEAGGAGVGAAGRLAERPG